MKLNKTLCLLPLICILIFFSGCAKYKMRRSAAFNNIELLKENVLLVRLKSADKKIAALEKANKEAEIVRTKQKLKAQNESIINAFKDNFTFCETYFFYGSEAKFLRQQQYDEMTLYNSNNKPVQDKSFIKNGHLVAAFDYIHEYQFVEETDSVRMVAAATYSYPSLVVMDKDFVPLPPPFPRRVLTKYKLLLDPVEVVALNVQLFEYHEKHGRYKARKAKRLARKQNIN